MDRSRKPHRALPTSLAAALAFALSVSAIAQTTPGGDFRDFKLPPKPTSSPVVGPVDGDTPAPRRTAPTPTPAPVPTVAPPPPSARATPQPAPAPSRQAPPQAQPRATAPVETQPPASADTPAPVAVPTTSSGSLFPSAPSTAAAELPPESSPRVIEEDGGDSLWWLWPLLALGLAGLAGLGWMLWRRRAEATPAEPEFVRPRVPVAEPDPAPAPVAAPVTAPASEPLPTPAFASSQPGLSLALEVVRMSATLVNATLTYRLKVANTGTLPIAEVSIAGDMVSAHASVPNAEMLGADGVPMPELHRITALAPGESKVLTGDIRLPLAAIIPIQRGDARLFVPLARFRSTGTCAGVPVIAHSAFLVGQEPEARAKLQPFRLDLGPRMYSQVGQRPIVVAA